MRCAAPGLHSLKTAYALGADAGLPKPFGSNLIPSVPIQEEDWLALLPAASRERQQVEPPDH